MSRKGTTLPWRTWFRTFFVTMKSSAPFPLTTAAIFASASLHDEPSAKKVAGSLPHLTSSSSGLMVAT